MAFSDRKFHDYDMGGAYIGKRIGTQTVVAGTMYYTLTNLPKGSVCMVFEDADRSDCTYRFCRYTRNEGMFGSTRYEYYSTVQGALDAGQEWAWRKDEQRARAKRKRTDHAYAEAMTTRIVREDGTRA
jgi:hypothetical protein